MYIHIRYRLNDRDENQIIYSLYTEKLNILEHPVSLIYELKKVLSLPMRQSVSSWR